MILLYNASIYGKPKKVDSLVIKKDKIYFIGQFNKIPNGEYRKKINIKKKLILPAFIDSHTHFAEYSRLKLQINCSNIKNIKELDKVIKNNPLKTKGYGLKFYMFNKEELNDYFFNLRRELEIIIVSSDYHSYLISSKGLLELKAFENYQKNVINTNELEDVKNLENTVKELYKYGITTIHEMAFSRKDFEIYDEIITKIDIYRHFPAEMLDEIIKNGVNSYKNIKSLKLFYDGSISSGSALMFSSKITKEQGRYGRIAILEKNIEKALKNDISVSVHAIGDKAVDDIVNIFIKYKELIKDFVRIEHAELITDKTIKNLDLLKDKVYLSMQPLHIRDDYILLIDKEVKNTSFRFKSLKNMVIGFGSDTPIVEFNPFLGIYYAITNKLNPNELITIEDAIDNYTINAARLSNMENLKGSIKVGKLADLMIINDYKNHDNDFWLNCKNYLTIKNGEIIFNELF